MRKNKSSRYTRIVAIRFKPEEYDLVLQKCKSSTTKQLTVYIRKMALGEPIVLCYRNESADAFLAEMIELKNLLNAIGNNFNQVVRRMHTLDSVPQIKTWLMLQEGHLITMKRRKNRIG